MANQTLTVGLVTREALRVLVNNLTFTKLVNRDYDARFAVEGAKVGTSINIRKPPRYVGATGAALQVEDATETSVPLTLTTQYQNAISFTTVDLTLSVDDFSKRFIRPAVANMANRIDFDGMLQYQNIYNTIGLPGTVPNAALTYLQAGARLSDEAAPFEDRSLCYNPTMNATLVDALKGLFQAGDKVREQYNKGMMGTAFGFDFFVDQNTRAHTIGPLGGTPLVNGASQTGASLITDGWTAAAANRLKKGDVFTLSGVNAVNPQNKANTGALRQFVVTADTSSDGSGNLTIPISPAIVISGPFQTVTATPADNAVITIFGAASTVTPQGLSFHSDAFCFGCADLILPNGVDMKERISDKQLGMSIRLIRDYDINTDRLPCRLDLLGGWTTLYAELACRIAS